MEKVDIAVLLTCHNRKEKTVACLKSLFLSQDDYNDHHDNQLLLTVFLVDDGSTDGTSDEITRTFLNKMNVITIIKGDGNLYWAGGMRLAWRSSLEMRKDWDFFLLLNDDTILYKCSFALLFKVHDFTMEKYGKYGIYSGITCDVSKNSKVTYGGVVWVSRIWAKVKLLLPNGMPQMCDAANANIMLIPYDVTKKLGFLYEGYHHGYADYDYTIRARKMKIPVLVTSELCGMCNNNHVLLSSEILKMNYKERRTYFNSPLHSTKEYLLYIRRNFPFCYPFAAFGRFLSLYCPQLHYRSK